MQFNRFQTLADIFILIALVIFGSIIFVLLGAGLTAFLFKTDIGAVKNSVIGSPGTVNINLVKVFTLIVNFGTWVVSSFALLKIRQYNMVMTWQLRMPRPGKVLLALPFIFIALMFASSFLMIVNSSIPLPESIKNLSSEASQELLKNMLRMENTEQLIANIFLIGLAPALFEEIFFRGTLQRLLIHVFGNAHYGVILTSFIFAAVHLNVMQFIPMFFLALALGYVCHYSKSIWPAIILHFLNNTVAVLINYYEGKSAMIKQLADDNYNPPVIVTLLSFALIGGFFYWLVRRYNTQTEVAESE